MFGCIYQLWDWLEAPPLFNGATMDAKKLQHLQQQANAQKKLPLAYQTNLNDYRTATHSPVFQQQHQPQLQQPPQSYHHLSQHHHQQQQQLLGYPQSPTGTSSSGGPLSPIDMQPQPNKLLLKHNLGGGNTSSSSHSSPYHQSYGSSSGGAGGVGVAEQLYQSPSSSERVYLAATARLHATSANNPANALQQQYQQLQQAKMQAQMQTQSDAVQQQQRTFALRQAMNPPVPQSHYHMSQSSSLMSTMTLQQQQQQQQQQHSAAQQHQRAPPSTLNLASQFQPATGPLKVSSSLKTHYHQQTPPQQQQQQESYVQQQKQLQLQLQLQHQHQLQQQQQLQKLQHQQQLQEMPLTTAATTTSGSEQSPVYIQQNHPGHVVNQACQTQISAVKPGSVVHKITPSSEDSSSKSPAHAPLDRKKSVGSMQALKSPVTKRPPASPVTLSGWLYKQGSDGLKVWRKRWFVLAEYCLYYYKGPEEEKLLGSILLPSYKVSACLPEDKIYRKYAFKCEHQNMRTYWLAAETAESMVHWVRALTAATMMQAPSSGESDQNSQPSASSSLNHSGENSDSGIHTLQSQQSKMSINQGQVTPASDNGALGVGAAASANANSASSSNSGGGVGGMQPLYANAPPKPRRITDGGYSSPSPEHSIDNEHKSQQQQQQQQYSSRRSGIMSPTLQQMKQQQQHQQQQYLQQQQQQQRSQPMQQHHAIYDTRTGNVSSTLRLQQPQQQYSVDNLEAQFQQQQLSQLTGDIVTTTPGGTHANYMEMEEQIMRLQQQQQQQQQVDDMYGERELYVQKLMQQRYPTGHVNTFPHVERRGTEVYGRAKNHRLLTDYEDIYNMQHGVGSGSVGAVGALTAQEALLQEAASYRRPLSPPSYDGSKHVPAMPTRFTPNHLEATAGSNLNLRARPGTAIMRPHSADFLEYEARAEAAADALATNPAADTMAIKPDPIRAPRPKSSLDINRTPDSFYYSEASYAEKMRKSALYLQHPQPQQAGAQPQAQQAGGYRTASGDFLSPVGSGLNTIGYENPYERAQKRNELLSETLAMQGNAASSSSIPRMSRDMPGTGAVGAAHVRSASLHPHPQQQQVASPTQCEPTSPYFSPSLTTQQIIQQNEQFLRSASARLPKRSGGFDEDVAAGTGATTPQQTSVGNVQDGERKREESMKRLLEWKQRMLQSPLTRKSMQQAQAGNGAGNMTAMSKLGSNPNILLASTTVASGAHYGPQSTTPAAPAGAATGAMVGGVLGIQRSRSETHANVGPLGYNSYSSDDEDGIDIKASAGRSTTTATLQTRTQTQKQTRLHAPTAPTLVGVVTATDNATAPHSSNTQLTTATKAAAVANFDMQNVAAAQLTQRTATSAINNNNKHNKHNISNNNNDNSDNVKSQFTKALKPILKVTEPSHTRALSADSAALEMPTAYGTKTADPQNAKAKEPKAKLHLNMNVLRSIELSKLKAESSKSTDHEILAEVPILPKKPAPKSPQNTSYVPVYTTKTLTSTSPSKNYENVDMLPVKEKQESLSEVPCAKAEANELVLMKKDALVLPNAEETPMLMNLQIYKETQEAKQVLEMQTKSTESLNSPETTISESITSDNKIVEQVKNVVDDKHDNEDDDDDDTACEYTDDDLDEALAEDADVDDDSTVNELSNVVCKLELPDPKECAKIYENEPLALFDENHYLPMTPKRTDFLSNTGLKLHSTFEFLLEEENHYVEMTKFLSEDDLRSNYEVMCLGASITAEAASSSEASKHLQTQTEPLYMELSMAKAAAASLAKNAETTQDVPCKSANKKSKKASDTIKKKSKKSPSERERCQSKRKDLPDILKPPQSTLALDSDSSDDADDESSKHADAKKMRSRTRFSLSDTFRPASYYLGASTPLANCAESSDSEIVSPPPIPSSPPPMEELKTEEIFSSENYDTVKRRDSSSGGKFNLSYEQLPKMHASNTSLNLPKSEATLKSSRLSLPDQFLKARGSGHFKKPLSKALTKHHERTLSDSNYSFQTDNSSNTSSDFDLYNKLKQNSPSFVASPVRYQSNSSLPQRYHSNVLATGDSSETDSVEFRQRQGSDSELERQRSRRPLSEESISEIESLNEKFEDALNTPDLDAYLNQLQDRDLYLYQNTKFDASKKIMANAVAVAGAGILTNFIKPPEIFRTKDDDHFYGNIHFVSSTDSLQKLDTDGREIFGSVAKKRAELDISSSELLGATSLTPTSMDPDHTQFLTPLHSRNNSNISEQSAPYYYSELSSSREMLSTPTANNAPITLNNQRDVHAHSGCHITHIHNPIERHAINVESLADKDQAIDSKNLYQMKPNVEKLSYSTGKNLKHNVGDNLQQQKGAVTGAHLKQNNFQINLRSSRTELTASPMPMPMTIPTTSTTTTPHRLQSQAQLAFPYPTSTVSVPISTSARLAKNTNVQLGHVGVGVGDGVGGVARRSIDTSSNANKFPVLGTPASGELLWEEDALWRESLRRVSQRHARSLDDLDRIASPIMVAHRSDYRPDYTPKPKLTRDVTYVNDDVSQKLRAGVSRCRSQAAADTVIEDAAYADDHDVYVQLMAGAVVDGQQNDDVYEVLREDTSSNLSSNVSHKSTELDREIIRQWDSMSSGLMKNSIDSGGSSSNNQECNSNDNDNDNDHDNNDNENDHENNNDNDNDNVNEMPVAGAVKSLIQQLNANVASNNASN